MDFTVKDYIFGFPSGGGLNVLRRVPGLRCSSPGHVSVGTGRGYPVPEEEELRGELHMFLFILLSSLLPPGQQGGSVSFVCIPAEIWLVGFFLPFTHHG